MRHRGLSLPLPLFSPSRSFLFSFPHPPTPPPPSLPHHQMSLKASPSALMNSLVALIKLSHKLFDALTLDISPLSSLLSPHTTEVIVPFLSSPLSSGNSGGLGMCAALRYLQEITEQATGVKVTGQGEEGGEKVIEERGKGLAFAQLLVLLEYVFEMLESKSFHLRLVREIDRGEKRISLSLSLSLFFFSFLFFSFLSFFLSFPVPLCLSRLSTPSFIPSSSLISLNPLLSPPPPPGSS